MLICDMNFSVSPWFNKDSFKSSDQVTEKVYDSHFSRNNFHHGWNLVKCSIFNFMSCKVVKMSDNYFEGIFFFRATCKAFYVRSKLSYLCSKYVMGLNLNCTALYFIISS